MTGCTTRRVQMSALVGGKMCGYTLSAPSRRSLLVLWVLRIHPPVQTKYEMWRRTNLIMIGSACPSCCAIYKPKK